MTNNSHPVFSLQLPSLKQGTNSALVMSSKRLIYKKKTGMKQNVKLSEQSEIKIIGTTVPKGQLLRIQIIP